MDAHTRTIIAAAAFAYVTGRKVAGLYDHAAGRDVPIAAEVRGAQLQGFDGDRGVRFGGALPELHDAGDQSYVSIAMEGTQIHGFDRRTASHYRAEVRDGLVQIFDHAEQAWFSYDIQDAEAAQAYHRGA
ncbi:MAG: hypothetical protein KGJ57_10270 [Sphingomonadales bacterium]|nr:hypothetical protein [Sphingomonadales bacterium]MDE2169797.1 hypothetical protein [Sphingomonadales bacterium]